jgi:hypothetical protein
LQVEGAIIITSPTSQSSVADLAGLRMVAAGPRNLAERLAGQTVAVRDRHITQREHADQLLVPVQHRQTPDLLLVLGLAWPQLRLTTFAARTAFWLLVYSTFAILLAYALGAFWGAGNETMPLAAGAAHGSAAQEALIRLFAFSSAPTGLISFALMLWGLRTRSTADA